jgi:cardiolipin synthase A/B
MPPSHYTLHIGAAAFMAALEAALSTCQHSLYIQFSTFEGDQSGRDFAALLQAKAAQGIEIRLILDYYSDVVVDDIYPIFVHRWGEIRRAKAETRALLDSLRAAGVAIKRTAPPGFLGRFMLYRDHKKMIVIDECVAFVGGINISDHNYAWHDLMFQMEGGIVAQLCQDFLSTWAGATLPLNAPASDTGEAVVNQCAGRYAILEAALRLIEGAEERIFIHSPYLLGDHLEAALERAARRGVQVTLLMPYRNNKWLYRLWVGSLRRRLQALPQVQIYGYRGDNDMTHAKLILIDGRRVTFGSCNFFELEGLAQKELNIFSSDPGLLAQVEESIAADLARSEKLPPPRWVWGRFTYTWLYRFMDGWTRRLLTDPDWRARYC